MPEGPQQGIMLKRQRKAPEPSRRVAAGRGWHLPGRQPHVPPAAHTGVPHAMPPPAPCPPQNQSVWVGEEKASLPGIRLTPPHNAWHGTGSSDPCLSSICLLGGRAAQKCPPGRQAGREAGVSVMAQAMSPARRRCLPLSQAKGQCLLPFGRLLMTGHCHARHTNKRACPAKAKRVRAYISKNH